MAAAAAASAAAPAPAPPAACEPQPHHGARPPSPLLDSGVLPVLLHHPAMLSHGIVCRLLCCSSELRANTRALCVGLVTVALNNAAAPPCAWLRTHAALMRALVVDLASLDAGARQAAEAGLTHALAASEAALCLSAFAFSSEAGPVPEALLKRLPVRTMASLSFVDNAQARTEAAKGRLTMTKKPAGHHQQHHHHHHGGAGAGGASSSKKQQRRGGGHGRRKPAEGSLASLALAVRRLSALTALTARISHGYADFLLPHVAFLKHLTRLELAGVKAPNRQLSGVLPKGLKQLRLVATARAAGAPASSAAASQAPLDMSRCKALTRLEMPASTLRAVDTLPPGLVVLQLGGAAAIEPLLPLQRLASLALLSEATPDTAHYRLSALQALTELQLAALHAHAALPARLQRLQLATLGCSGVPALTGLQALSELRVRNIAAAASSLAALSGLRGLRCVCAGVHLARELPLYLHLELFWTWGQPLRALDLRFATLSAQHLALLGQLPHLTGLQLGSCSGALGPVWSPDAPYASLSEPIATWTRLESLSLRGRFRIKAAPAPDYAGGLDALPREQADVLQRAAEAAVARQPPSAWPDLLGAALGRLTRLTQLALAGEPLAGAGAASLAGLAPALRSLTLSDAGLRDFDVVGLMASLSGLTHLDVSGNGGMTAAPLAGVDRLLPRLGHLDVRRTGAAKEQPAFAQWLARPRSARVVWHDGPGSGGTARRPAAALHGGVVLPHAAGDAGDDGGDGAGAGGELGPLAGGAWLGLQLALP